MAIKTNTRLTRKDKAYLDLLIKDDKIDQTDAYMRTHDTTRDTARANSSRVLAKASSQIYLQNHVDIASQAIVSIAGNEEAKDSDRIKASQDILDRTHGKALIKQITENTNLNVNVEASDQLAADFLSYIKQATTTKQHNK